MKSLVHALKNIWLQWKKTKKKQLDIYSVSREKKDVSDISQNGLNDTIRIDTQYQLTSLDLINKVKINVIYFS